MDAEALGRDEAVEKVLGLAVNEWAEIHRLDPEDRWPEMQLWRAAALIKVLAINMVARRVALGSLAEADERVMGELTAGLKALYKATTPDEKA